MTREMVTWMQTHACQCNIVKTIGKRIDESTERSFHRGFERQCDLAT